MYDNCQKIRIWARRPETILEIGKKTIYQGEQLAYHLQASQEIPLRIKKKAYKPVAFSLGPLLNIVKHRDHRLNLYKILNIYWRDCYLIYMKFTLIYEAL